MLKNVIIKSGNVFFPVTCARFVHTRLREAFLARQIEYKRPSYNNNYDPQSRNVLRMIEERGEEGFLEEMEDEVWRAERNIFDPFSDESEQQRILKEKIRNKLEKKKLGLWVKEPNLLTWAARTQIRFLHAQDPYKWTAEVLADSFPVSKGTIIRILKSKWLPVDEIEIERFDRKVYKNWLRLKSDLENQTESFRWLENGKRMDERFSKMINAAGIPSLPVPSTDEIILTREKLVEKLHPKVKGPFSSIIDDYKAQFKENENQGISAKSQSQNLAIGDKEAVQLLSSISTLHHERKKQEETKGVHEEEGDDEQTQFQLFSPKNTKNPDTHKENQSKIGTNPEAMVTKQSRRRRRLQEVSVNKDTVEELQMLGTGRVS